MKDTGRFREARSKCEWLRVSTGEGKGKGVGRERELLLLPSPL